MSEICECCGQAIKKKKKPPDPRIKEFFTFYHDLYVAKFYNSPSIVGGRDAIAIKRMLKNWEVEVLSIRLMDYFTTEDNFYISNGYDIPRFEKYMSMMGVTNGSGTKSIRGTGGGRDEARNEIDNKVRAKLGLSTGCDKTPRIKAQADPNGRREITVGEGIIEHI